LAIDRGHHASGAVGTSVTISGTTFGSTQGSSSVSFNGTATTPSSWTATSIVAPVPSGATTGPVVVIVSGSATNGINLYRHDTWNDSRKDYEIGWHNSDCWSNCKGFTGRDNPVNGDEQQHWRLHGHIYSAGRLFRNGLPAGYGTRSQNSAAVNSGATTIVNLNLDSIVAGPVSYIYDVAGRLISTVGPTDTVTYTYDATGNLLSVSRQNSSQLSIINVVPNGGPVGATVTIYGSGFSSVANENTVQFGGVAATIIAATPTQIVTTVPPIGSTGLSQIAVTAPGDPDG
jgi:YD repeat-containing protein